MAHRRFATAVLVKPQATERGWERTRTAAARLGGRPSASLVQQATEILGTKFDPSRYLLSHCTLVASVDVEEVPNIRLGSVKVDGRTINRKYSDYRITSATDQYINNNCDAFEKRVLLKSYRTLVGAHNFVEHVQVEDLSKGRLIDAVSRDIGDSVYIDILVATDRKHKSLIRDIESQKTATLSMGCTTATTTCTKCGNVAIDETDLCECVRYQKGNIFFDENGGQHRVAELCGHFTMDDPPGGVQFIEASWVKSPAFTGAVLRNVLNPGQMSERAYRQAQEILNSPPPHWVDDGSQRKAASDRTADFDFGDVPAPDAGGDGAGDADAKKDETKDETPKPDLHELEDRILGDVLDSVEKRVQEELKGKRKPPEDSSASRNDSLQASQKFAAERRAYTKAASVLVRTARTDIEVMDRIASLDREFGIAAPVSVYRAVLRAGSMSKYGSADDFMSACRDALGDSASGHKAAILRLGRILAMADAVKATTPDVTHRSQR